MVIELWNFDLVRYNLYHQGEQARANVESGFLLYSRDSTLSYRWEGDSSVLLFGQREDSRVRYSRQRWGMYEVVEVQNGRHRSVRLLGKKAESFWRATLYVPENNRAFSVTGRTFAEGDVYLPRNGISYTQLRSEFFKGRALDKKQIKTSEERLPPLDEEWSTGDWIMPGRENGWKMVPCYNEGSGNRLFEWKWGNIFPACG